MKKELFCTLAAGVVMLTACNNEEWANFSSSNDSVHATLPENEGSSRTTLNSSLQVVWEAGDQISIFKENNGNFSNNLLTLSEGAGTTGGTFSGVTEGNGLKAAAVFPYKSTTTYANGTVSIKMENTYTYKENNIGGAPMAAQIKENAQNTIAFQNAGALMGITVNNIPAGCDKVTLTSLDGKAIAGDCEITFDAIGLPTLKAKTGNTVTDADKTITINFTASQSITNKTFYFPIPVADYNENDGLKVSLWKESTETVLKTKTLNAERSQRYKSTLTLDAVNGTIPVAASGAAAANTALNNGNTSLSITLSSNDGNNPIITLPSQTNTNDNKPTALAFAGIPTGTTVSINAPQGEITNESREVRITASSDNNSANNFNINLPNSTVTLDADGESTTYNEVTAETAENTLVIGKGVIVNKLIIKAGNVKVLRGATLKQIVRQQSNTKITYLIVEEGANVPNDLDKDIEKVSSENHPVSIDNMVMTADASVAVSKKASLTSKVNRGTSAVGPMVIKATEIAGLDAEESTLNIAGTSYATIQPEEGKTLTFKNLTITDNVSAPDDPNGKAWEWRYPKFSGKVIFENCTIINGIQLMDGADATFTQCTFTNNDEDDYAVWCAGGKVTVDNCTFKGYRGVKAHQYEGASVDVTIQNSTFNASKKPGFNAGDLKSDSKVTISGNTFISRAIYESDTDITSYTFKEENNKIGITNKTELFAFAAQANKGDLFQGKTIVLLNDIDLANNSWTPIATSQKGFFGTFDGCNHTIKNLKVTTPNEEGSAGLFAWINAGTVKNLHIENADVTGHHWVGTVVGFNQFGIIENCTVKNATVNCTGVKDATNQEGDKCGGIVGQIDTANPNGGNSIKNCSVSHSTIKAARDAGQVIGASEVEKVTNCTATEVTVEYNNTGIDEKANTNIRAAIIGREL